MNKTWGIFGVLLLITVACLIIPAMKFFAIGIAVHDTIYMANPDLGPEGWIKYTEPLIQFFTSIAVPIFLLLVAWILICGIFINSLNKKKR